MEITERQQSNIALYFRISIYIKGLISLVEVLAGLLALLVPVSYVSDVVVALTRGELAEDPGDFIANHLVTYAHQLSLASGTFLAVYLITRGLIKVGLIFALIKNQLWAYPSSLVVLGLFVIYQGYQIVTTGSGIIVALTIFDLIVMWFIWKEYQIVRSVKTVKKD